MEDATTRMRLGTTQAKDKITCDRLEHVYDSRNGPEYDTMHAIRRFILEDKLSHNLYRYKVNRTGQDGPRM